MNYSSGKWLERAALLISGGLGLALFVAGCVLGFQRYALYRDGDMAQGRIVEIRVSESSRALTFYPVVEFATSGGVKQRVEGSVGGKEYEIGETVNVLYNPKNPSDAQIANFRQLWSLPLILGGIGFLILAIIVFILTWPRVAAKAAKVRATAERELAAAAARRRSVEGKWSVIEIHEPRESWRANIVWGLALGLSLIVPQFLGWEETSWLEKYGLIAAGVAWMGFMGLSAFRNYGRTVRCDDTSIEVLQAFGAKRILLSDVKKVTRDDAREKFRALGNVGDFGKVGHIRKRTTTTIAPSVKYVLYDAQGKQLLRLAENMEPAAEMRRFLDRLEHLTGGSITDE